MEHGSVVAPRRGRRTLASWTRLLLIAVLTVSTWIVATPATAFVPGVYEPAAGDQAPVTATLTHNRISPLTGSVPAGGETFNYTGTFGISGTPLSTATTTTIKLFADSNAPFNAVPATITLNGTAITPTTANCTASVCTYTFSNLAPGSLVINKQAVLATGLPAGTVIMASADVGVKTTPDVKLVNVSATPIPAGQCSGTYTFVQRVGGSGAWLVDMKFGDLSGQGKVGLTADGDTVLRAWNTPGLPAGSDTIKFVDVNNNNDITLAVMANATYNSNDPSSPTYSALADGGAGQYANTRWTDALNWSYDPSSWTGNTWLPAGTMITVTRAVTYQNCVPGGFTTDGDTSRLFGISTEIARPTTDLHASAYDVFSTPGYVPPASCASSIYVSSNLASASTAFYRWNPSVSKAGVGSVTPRVDAIAATVDHPSWIYNAQQNGSLAVWDTSTLAPVPGTGSTAAPAGITISTFNALAFAPDGSLWGASSGNLYYLDATQVSQFLAGSAVTWNSGTNTLRRQTLSGTNITATYAIADMAFDGDGNLWMIGSETSLNNKTQYIGMLTPSQLKNYSSGAIHYFTSWVDVGTLGDQAPRGLAFLGDKMYIGAGITAAGTGLYEVYWKSITTWQTTPSPILSANLYSASSTPNSIPNPSDFASCAFPKKNDVPPPSGPAYKVQKVVINADGSIAPPGTASTAGSTSTTRTINADGTVTIDYLVTVTAVGTTAGSFPPITDNVTVPAGFTVNQLLLNGTAQASTSSFTIPSAALDPLGTDPLTAPISRTYKVTIKATAANLSTVNWTTASTCNTTGAGTPSAGGFFNLVTMTGDVDLPNNNDACAPVSPPGTASLGLIKTIVDANGNVISSKAADAQYFTLMAAGPLETSGSQNGGVLLQGSSSTSGATVGPWSVVPGTYQLSEQPKDGGTTTGGYTFGTWTCLNGATPVPVDPATNQITVATGMNITCTVTNTPKPVVYVVKNATTPIAGNTHIGTTVTPASDGTFTANYTITVTSMSNFISNTGPINDYFTPPPGTVWDGIKTATITFVPGTTGATLANPKTTATQIELQNGATLATSILKLPANASVSFTISIPLKLDDTVAPGQTLPNSQLFGDNLASCNSLTSPTNVPYTNTQTGIPNVVNLTGEYLGYNDVPLPDNIACIPVKRVGYTVAKTTTQGPIVLNPGDTTVSITYTVTTTNTGTATGTTPPVYDTPVVPAGFTLSSVVVDGTTVTAGANGYTVTAGDTLAPGATKAHTVVVTFTVNQTQINRTDLSTCNTSATPDSTKGIYNSVAMLDDGDGADNNDACVPVTVREFAVAKSTSQGPITLTANQTSVSISYTVAVSNTGNEAGTSPPVYDLPRVPAGFTLTSVTVDGVTTAANPDQTYTVTAGDALAAPPAAGSTIGHIVVVTYAIDQAQTDSATLGTCDTATPNPLLGVFNSVSMSGDSDVTNNHVCVPVTLPKKTFQIHKFSRHCDVGQSTCDLNGAAFALYNVDPATDPNAQPITDGITVDPANGSMFTSVPLSIPQTYWLVETQAPPGFSLLAQSIKFELSGSGITILSGGSADIVVSSSNAFLFEIENNPNAALPEAGGSGHLSYALAGLAMLLAGLAFQTKNSRSRSRHATS